MGALRTYREELSKFSSDTHLVDLNKFNTPSVPSYSQVVLGKHRNYYRNRSREGHRNKGKKFIDRKQQKFCPQRFWFLDWKPRCWHKDKCVFKEKCKFYHTEQEKISFHTGGSSLHDIGDSLPPRDPIIVRPLQEDDENDFKEDEVEMEN